jgi:hypothetical protein
MNYKLYLLTNTFKQHEIDQLQFREIQRIKNKKIWTVNFERLSQQELQVFKQAC